MKLFNRLSLAAAGAVSLVVVAVSVGPGTAQAHKPKQPSASKAILFASDGMRPDLVEKYARLGLMPSHRDLMNHGVRGKNGLLQAFPPNTGVGWATLATGAWPSEHGSTNNTFHRNGVAADFARSSSGFGTGILQADTIQQAAERAGKTVVSVEWVASRGLTPALKGPVVDFRSFFSNRGILLNFDIPGHTADAFGVSYQRTGQKERPTDPAPVPEITDASGWSAVPASHSPAKQAQLLVRNTTSGLFLANVDRRYDLYIYDSTNDGTVNYDRVLVVPSTAGKNGAAGVATLARGQWSEVKVTLTDTRAGQTAGFYLKLIDLSPNLDRFRLYFTSIARVNASYNGCTYAPGCNGPLGFEDTLAKDFPTATAGDFAPLEAGIVDEDTYVEQGLMWKDAHWAYLRYIIDTLGVKPDLLLAGNPVTDEFQHQFLALVTSTDIDGDPNPYFDDVTNDNVPDGRIDAREGYIRAAYHEADQTLALARSLMGGNVPTFVSSDHGFAPQWRAVNARRVLWEATVRNTSTGADVRLHGSGENATGNCGAATPTGTPAVSSDLAKACWAGGAVQIYVNPTLPAGITYEAVRTAAINAFQSLTDADNPGKQVVSRVFKKEELRNVDGTDALHPNRSGDVVVVTRPPYQFDAGTPGVKVAFSQFFGQHGYLPDLVNLKRNVNMHATFVAAGPGIRGTDEDDDDDDDDDGDRGHGLGGRTVSGVRAIDVAPTISYLMGIPGPQNASGRILYEALEHHGDRRELTILDISDYHGQLVPLTEAADFNFDAATNTLNAYGGSFALGGSAFLKPWFDAYRREAKDGSITITAGDAIGATPPISSHFGDKTTIEMMNRMGFDADGLGNHNFDRGQAYLRNEIIPLAKFSYVSANIVDGRGRTPREWSPSETFSFHGAKLGLIGFSNTDIPLLTFPGALGPFQVTDPLVAVNAEAARLDRKTDALVAIGHLGADSGTTNPIGLSTNPAGPVIALADGANVDAVVGDHTNFQVLDVRPNGVLVTENLSKGVRFTRLRLVVDKSRKEVVYKTADFHKPWNIGATPNTRIQQRIDELNAILAPILGVEVGKSTVAIPRSDVCGRVDGRLCESLVGDVVTDSMRTAFAGTPSFSIDFAITNSGGLRAALTCPSPDQANDFCPAFTPPPYPITLGQVVTVLPFGNVVATARISGTHLKAMLENGVSQMPSANGRFAQVSGLCFTYDIAATAGSRVTSVLKAAGDGSCPAGSPAVGLGAADQYTVAINDFMAFGGDGYPNLVSQLNTPSVITMDRRLADYIGEQLDDTVSPAIQGRVRCVDGNGAAVPNCPAGSP